MATPASSVVSVRGEMESEGASARELRALWAAGGGGEAHPADLARLQQDWWAGKFVAHCEGDMPQALQMLTDTLAWRASFGANDLTEDSLNLDHLRAGLFYPRGRDNDGCALMVFKGKKHVKGQRNFDEVMRCLIYWFERLEKRDREARISVFFDMSDTGLSHMDMEFTRYIINLFKHYYPDFLNYIFIYEMPWVLTAAFKVIKTLLPAKAVTKLKFITKANVKEFIPPEHVHVSWGGSDDYVYSFEPVADVPSSDPPSKKVTFADPGTPIRDGASSKFEEDDREGSLMTVSPRDVIVFKKQNDENSSCFTLANPSGGNVAFKVRTTAPDRIKVTPSVGVLPPGEIATVKITLCATQLSTNLSVAAIKLLIVCAAVDRETMSQQELTDVWKNSAPKRLQQHRLRCSVSEKTCLFELSAQSKSYGGDDLDRDPTLTTDGQRQLSLLNRSIAEVKATNDTLLSQIKTLQTLQLISLTLSALFLYLIVHFFLNNQYAERCGDSYNGP